MKFLQVLLSAVAVALLIVVPTPIVADESLELTDDNFDSELEALDVSLVMFYAPWCGHCKKLKPEFAKASIDLKKNDPAVSLVKVDCTEGGKDTCGRFEVRGYPTLKIFRNGEFSQDYNGPREAGGIVKFMKSQAGPSSKELADDKDLSKFLALPEVTVVSYVTDKSENSAFQAVADALRENVAFGHFTGKSSDKKGVVLNRPKHLQTKMEASELTFDGKMSKDSLKEWVLSNYHGLVGHRTPDNQKDFKTPLVIAYYDVDYTKNVKGTNYWRNRVMKVAKDNKDLTFAISNKNDFMQEATEFGLSAVSEDKPQVVIKGADKYVMDTEFSVDNLAAFLKQYNAGELEAYLKSEPVPESNDAPVKVAVAKNFNELVLENDNDVLIEFYAPWCGHCKKLVPVYDELAEKMEKEDVTIVKMDATANDVPSQFDVRGFPTLFWLPKGSKKPTSYNGGREVDDFVKFIAENASDELKGYTRKGKAKKTEL